MTDQSIHAVPDNLKPLRSDADRVRPLVRDTPNDDSVRWLVGVMVELSRRFLGHAIKRYPEFESNRQRCAKCGERG